MEIRDCSILFLTRKSRSSYEVEKHLIDKGFKKDEIEEEIRFLKEFHYLDDTGYCRRYLEQSLEKGRSLFRIERELKERGIFFECFEEALIEAGIADKKELERERAVAQAKKIAAGQTLTEALFGKIGRKLFAQGFNTDIIYSAISFVRDGNDNTKSEETKWEE